MSDSASLNAHFGAAIDRLINRAASNSDNTPEPHLLIALSGGVDSVVLASLASKHFANHQVRAVYIDHGLQVQSAEWAELCYSFCQQLGIDFQAISVEVNLSNGASPEAAARDARYSALQHNLQPGEFLCTAHHADDQAETLLLQLLRGAGVNGLAGIAGRREYGQGVLIRPLLDVSRAEIESYAHNNQLSYCEDPQNTDLRYDRNFVRHEVLPLVAKRWPTAAKRLSRTAAHCREAAGLLAVLADHDHPGVAHVDKLSIEHLQALPLARQKNLLRQWIVDKRFLSPSETQLQQIVDSLLYASADSHGRISFGEAQVARYDQHIYLGARGMFDPVADFEFVWSAPHAPLPIAAVGITLHFNDYPQLQPYVGNTLMVRNRRGGERLRKPGAQHSVSLKSLLQQRRIPPWLRSRLALVFCNEELLCIGGLQTVTLDQMLS